jgi:hypothetical protein
MFCLAEYGCVLENVRVRRAARFEGQRHPEELKKALVELGEKADI